MLLSGQLLQQVVVGGVGGELTLGQSVSQPVLVGKEQPDLPSPAFRNTCTQRDTQTIMEDQRTAKTHKLNYFWLILGRLHNNFEALSRTYDLSYTGPDSTLCPIKTHTHTHTHLSPWQRARYSSSLSCGTVILPGAVSFLSHNASASLEHWPTSW